LRSCDAFADIFVASIATTPTFTNPARAHTASTSVNNPASAVSCRTRNSAIVEWSGFRFAAITRNATSSTHARSICLEDRIPNAYEYNNNATTIDGSYAARP
jgi:hypothetical protein